VILSYLRYGLGDMQRPSSVATRT